MDAFEGTVEEIQTRATIVKTYDAREVVIPNADLFTRSVIVNTAFGARRWEYDLNLKDVEDLETTKSEITQTIASVPGVLADPAPEALVLTIDLTNPGAATIRVLWWTNDSRQHQMLASYDKVLTTTARALSREGAPSNARVAAGGNDGRGRSGDSMRSAKAQNARR